MAELVRQKKPKHRERPESDVAAPPIPARSVVVNGVRLPEVPTHILEEQRERSASPEPEEQQLSDTEGADNDEKENPPAEIIKDARNSPHRPAPPPPRTSQEREAPPIPPRNLIFPRSSSMVAETTREPSPALAAPKRSVAAVTPYPVVPELAELPSYTAALNHPQVYPAINGRQMQHSHSATALPEKVRMSDPVEHHGRIREGEAPPMYPSLCSYERNEHGLMTEENLVEFYHNPLYEYADKFVDQFIRAEEVPSQSGSLFSLLKRLKEVCGLMTVSEVKGKENTEELQKCLRGCWVQQTLSVEGKGKCGDNNEGSGRATYFSYGLQKEILEQMKKLLATNRTNLMDHTLCEETSFRSLALQIQWQVIIINNNFMAENGLTTRSPPCLIETGAMTPSRTALRTALSDLFYHLRYPRLSKRFIDTIVGWIKELICILNMRQSCDDGIFILCHLLRLPSPIDQWAVPFVQTFIQSQSPPQLKLNYCVALLTHLLNPIKARESFLRHVAQSEKEESAWEILADDDDGEANEFSFVTINESDLTAFLDQLPISELYSIAYLAFTSYADKGSQFTGMVAFQLLLMKILDNGLSNYAKPGYKMFCKQIGISLKHSVRELCSNWRLVRDQIQPSDERHLQKEVDRIVLLALNYLIHRDSVGLFQFVVALPYGVVSEECRNRCEYALRSTQKMSIQEIYETPICEVQARIKSQGIIKRIGELDAQDKEFLINSLASIGSVSTTDVGQLLKELIDVCFCEETTRNDLYKCGGEAIGQILTKRPDTLHQLLTVIDRNLQHMDSYAINVLSSSRLFDCRLTEPMISIIGKWLINNPPEHGANRLARRVLSSLHWGLAADGQNLWIDVDVHSIAADTVVKAHSVHCSRSNSMIAKSIKQITKLASKVGDAESLFQQFCWDLLVKLKLPAIPATLVQNDLTAHYVRIVQNYEDDAVVYLEKGVPLLSDLVSSGSSVACVVLLSRFIAQHYSKVTLMAADKKFMETFDCILNVDQLPYAKWFSDPASPPTPIVRLICSGISYYSAKLPPRDFLRAWITLLTTKTGWNNDAVTYQIIGTIARIAFVNDSQKLYEITSIIFQAYQQQLAAEKNQSKGLFSMFSSESAVSPLIPDTMLGISPFASYLMLRVEQKSFNTFYGHFFEALAKKDKYTLDYAVKKAASKCSMTLPVERIAVFRWAKLVSICKDSPLLPILIQQLAGSAYRLRKANNLNLCYARRLIDDVQAQEVMDQCRKALEETTVETKGLAKAVIGWLFTKHEVTRTGFDFSVFDLDYLLQLILSGDKNQWLEFVNMPQLSSEEFAEQKLYSVTCQLSPKMRNSPLPPDLGSPRSSRTSAKPFPVLPVHSGLPQAPNIDPSMLFQQHTVMQLTTPFIKTIKKLAEQYTQCGDKMAIDDEAYCKLITTLYQPTPQTVPIEIRCSYCSKPKACTMNVQANVLNGETDAQMSMNRNKRIEFWNELNASLMDKAAMATASMEHISRTLARMASTLPPPSRNNVQLTGRSVFYLMTSSVGENELLFCVASEAYNHSLRSLGQEFVKFRAEEQMDVMQLALEGFVLSEPLVEAFTPEVLNSDDLCTAYRKLSDAVRMPERSKMALQLLGRLGMQQAAAGLPPHQFAALLPIAFANLASQPDPSSPLHTLCLQHVIFFVFHHFPDNIVSGLNLALEGCNTNSTPSSLLDAIVDKLDAKEYLQKKSSHDLGAAKADECARVLAKRLDEARTKLPNFYGVWSRYMEPVTRLGQLFLFVPIRDGYEPNKSVMVLQQECYEYFARVAAVFSPLIAPYSPTHPPFSPSHETQAMLVLDRLIEFLSNLHFNSSIPPGMQNIQSLVWQYYYEKLSILTHGTQHYYDVMERQLVRLNWQALWPSRLAITAMETCLDTRSPDCASFISQIVARIPWSSILQTMPEANRPGYMASLFGVLVRLAARPRNYDKVRASLLELVKSLSLRTDWNQIDPEDAASIARAVAKSLPPDSLSNPVEMVSVIQIIWRKASCFVAREPFAERSLQKQTIWMQTECSLLLKADSSKVPAAYNSLISDVNTLALNHSNLKEFRVVTRELTALWKNISDPKLGECLVSLWTDYLSANPTSPLILTSVNTIIESLNVDQLTTALKVVEKTVAAYFLRTDSSWAELQHWIQFPSGSLKSIKSYLLTVPSSENKVLMLPLTLRVFMDFTEFSSSDDNKFFDLHHYVTSIRPKHVTSEAGFVCLLARLVQWMAARSPTLPAHFASTDDLLPPIIKFLNKAGKYESGFLSNLMGGSKKTFSQKMCVVLQVLELYLTQQTIGEGKRPRCDANSPVLNSRISTLKDLAQQKAHQNMNTAFNKATAYFVQIDTHQIQSSAKLLLEIGRCAFGDRFLSDV